MSIANEFLDHMEMGRGAGIGRMTESCNELANTMDEIVERAIINYFAGGISEGGWLQRLRIKFEFHDRSSFEYRVRDGSFSLRD